MILRTISGEYIEIALQDIQTMARDGLIEHLERRGFACEPIDETDYLRQMAIEDWETELMNKLNSIHGSI